MKYDAQYFIDKFEAIPDEKWCTKTFANNKGAFCALGHCGAIIGRYGDINTEESLALKNLFASFGADYDVQPISFLPSWINDGKYKEFLQETPKARMLAALQLIKDNTSENIR